LPPFTSGTPEFFSPGCTDSRYQWLSRNSRFRCSGIRGWMGIRHIAGFVGVFETLALSSTMRKQRLVLNWCGYTGNQRA
jgi:hypothetical protein